MCRCAAQAGALAQTKHVQPLTHRNVAPEQIARRVRRGRAAPRITRYGPHDARHVLIVWRRLFLLTRRLTSRVVASGTLSRPHIHPRLRYVRPAYATAITLRFISQEPDLNSGELVVIAVAGRAKPAGHCLLSMTRQESQISNPSQFTAAVIAFRPCADLPVVTAVLSNFGQSLTEAGKTFYLARDELVPRNDRPRLFDHVLWRRVEVL